MKNIYVFPKGKSNYFRTIFGAFLLECVDINGWCVQEADQGLRGGGAGLPALSVTNRSRYSSIFFVKAPFIIKSRITKT